MIPEPNGGFRARNSVVWQLIRNAYYIRDQQLTGGPAWIKSDRYDIAAKAEETEASVEGAGPGKTASRLARHRRRLQSLLRDRFGLVGRTVVDRTGLTQHYNVKLEWTPDTEDSGEGGSIFTAVREQLGLRLESEKGPAPVFVIEKIDRPSEN